MLYAEHGDVAKTLNLRWECIMQTIDLVRIAFRKLKAHVFFDKTTLPLRDKIVEFEVSSDFA